mgnify:CR=1 FL=1|jgi:hypothetical protein
MTEMINAGLQINDIIKIIVFSKSMLHRSLKPPHRVKLQYRVHQ